MHSNFHVVKRSPSGKANRTVIAENWEISSQGKAEKQSGGSTWEAIGSGKFSALYMDSDLDNIWTQNVPCSSKKISISCLRALGVDQEVVDCEFDEWPKPGYSSPWIVNFVRGNTGRSMFCTVAIPRSMPYTPSNASAPLSDIEIREIGFDEDGYHVKEACSITEEMDMEIEDFNWSDPFWHWKVWDWKKKSGPYQEQQSPHWKSIPVIKGEYRVPGEEGRLAFAATDTVTIVWNFEKGFEVTRSPIEEELGSIKIPGSKNQNQIKIGGDDWFDMPTLASQFEEKGAGFGYRDADVRGIRPFGDTPQPRFPRAEEELKFERDTKKRLRSLASRIGDLEGMIQQLKFKLD